MHDPNPERRNLLVTSIAFLLYFLAGGKLADDVVRLHFINLKFENPLVFVIFAWVILLWFLFRYWLLHSGKFTKAFREELTEYHNHKPLVKEVERQLGRRLSDDKEAGPHMNGLTFKTLTLKVPIVWAKQVSRDRRTGRITSRSGDVEEKGIDSIFLKGIRGRSISLAVVGKCFFNQPGFSSYALPYIIFAAVLIAAVVHVF